MRAYSDPAPIAAASRWLHAALKLTPPIGTSGDAAGALQSREVREAKWEQERGPRTAGSRTASQGGGLSQVSPRLCAAGVGSGWDWGWDRDGDGDAEGDREGDGLRVPRARVDLWWRDVGWMGKANRRLRVRGVCHHSRPTPWQELRRAHALGSAGAPSGSAEPKSPLRSRAAVLETTTKTLEETVLDSALAI